MTKHDAAPVRELSPEALRQAGGGFTLIYILGPKGELIYPGGTNGGAK